jgi:hypothetical protein
MYDVRGTSFHYSKCARALITTYQGCKAKYALRGAAEDQIQKLFFKRLCACLHLRLSIFSKLSMSAAEAFERARAEFLRKKELSSEHRTEISRYTKIDDVYDETTVLQNKQGGKRQLRSLGKIRPFLECLQTYAGVIEVFVQVKPEILGVIWVG